jgi:chemotaxis signal transduction protein
VHVLAVPLQCTTGHRFALIQRPLFDEVNLLREQRNEAHHQTRRFYAATPARRLYNSEDMSEVPEDPQLHDLVPFVAGDKVFAVFADQVDGTAEAKVPVPLPNGPPAVLGVICVRGRMLTVIDPIALLTGESFGWPATLPSVIALRGDEQLALAAQSCRDTITIAASDIQPDTRTNDDSFESAAFGMTVHGGEEITVLRADNLFAAAVRRKERRRRRL